MGIGNLNLNLLRADDDAAAAFPAQAVRGLTAMLNQRGGAMTMRLDPPELGSMRVQMTIVGGTVSAEFQPGTAQAAALLERHMPALRQSLENQGLSVERLNVHAPPQASHPASQQQSGNADAQGDRRHGGWGESGAFHQHDAAGSESRGRQGQDARQSSSPQRAGAISFESLLGMDSPSELPVSYETIPPTGDVR